MSDITEDTQKDPEQERTKISVQLDPQKSAEPIELVVEAVTRTSFVAKLADGSIVTLTGPEVEKIVASLKLGDQLTVDQQPVPTSITPASVTKVGVSRVTASGSTSPAYGDPKATSLKF